MVLKKNINQLKNITLAGYRFIRRDTAAIRHAIRKLGFTLVFFISFAHAQQLTLKFSAGASTSRPFSNEYLNSQHVESGYGYFAEGGIHYGFNKKFALETGLIYSVNRYEVINSDQSAIRTNYHDHFLELPILLDYKLFTFWRTDLSLLSGIYASYWVKAQSEGLYANLFDSEWNPESETEIIALEPYADDISLAEGYNRFALGVQLGLGAKRAISNKVQLGIRTFFRQDLTNRLANDGYHRRYQRFTLEGNLFYTIGQRN